MDFEIATICEAATQSVGNLYILGAFNRLVSNTFPLTLPQCAVVFRIRFSRNEGGQHKLKISFVDDDGNKVINPIEADLPVKIENDIGCSVLNLILNMNQFAFKKPGDYSIDVLMDGKPVKSLPVFAVKAKASNAPPA